MGGQRLGVGSQGIGEWNPGVGETFHHTKATVPRRKEEAWDSYLECARYLKETFEKWIAIEEATSFRELKEFMVMEQFLNAAEKLVAVLQQKRFKNLKEAAMWVDDHVLANRPVPRWIG